MKKRLTLSILAILGLLLSSCLENSTVIKVKKDGSGIIHVRNYTNSEMGGMFGGLGGDSEDKEEEIDVPSEEELHELAAAMGEGVSFKSVKVGKNQSDWGGYEVVYEFQDINTLKVSLDTNNLSEQIGGGEGEEKKPEFVTFSMADNTLNIKTPFDESNAKEEAEPEEGESANPFGGESAAAGPGDLASMAMLAPMLSGARLGVFIEVEGEIEETNAKHQEGNLLTLVKMDLGKVFANPEAIGQMENMESGSREDAQAVADKIDGLDMDVQETITVKFK